jgi:hypothetical protein
MYMRGKARRLAHTNMQRLWMEMSGRGYGTHGGCVGKKGLASKVDCGSPWERRRNLRAGSPLLFISLPMLRSRRGAVGGLPSPMWRCATLSSPDQHPLSSMLQAVAKAGSQSARLRWNMLLASWVEEWEGELVAAPWSSDRPAAPMTPATSLRGDNFKDDIAGH